jgi:hypothetical protein
MMIKEIKNENINYFQDEIHVSAALFGGPINKLLEFYNLYYNKLNDYVKNNKFIDCDQ